MLQCVVNLIVNLVKLIPFLSSNENSSLLQQFNDFLIVESESYLSNADSLLSWTLPRSIIA